MGACHCPEIFILIICDREHIIVCEIQWMCDIDLGSTCDGPGVLCDYWQVNMLRPEIGGDLVKAYDWPKTFLIVGK